VAVRRFSPETGEVTGEYRFLGLYTQAAYTESVTRIPVLRRKVDRTLEIAGLPADSHDGKALIEILEGFPREELFEISAEQLAPIAMAVLGLAERKQVRLFLRPDAYGRYVSCLVYLPRDRYTTQVRLRAQEILRSAFGGDSVDYSAMVGNSALARLHVVVHAAPGCPLARSTRPPCRRGSPPRSAPGTRTWPEASASSARARRRGCWDLAPTASRRPTRPTPRPSDAVEDLAVVQRLRRVRPVRDPTFHHPERRVATSALPPHPGHAVGRAAAAAAHGARGARRAPVRVRGTTARSGSTTSAFAAASAR
jgi:hypothetical protein